MERKNCILKPRKSDGLLQCQRRGCRWVLKVHVPEGTPVHRGCNGASPGAWLRALLTFGGVTEERWLRLWGEQPNPCSGCNKRADTLDELWGRLPDSPWIDRVIPIARLYLRNYSTNIRLLINKLKGTP